ncbi:hypothetical protein CIHG_07025 [Coccidioides immitis H538.4]|uniref:Xylanolytic transcriptional activator regulatory domain-containing protein n=1 Tax=Coccidioides immitis H538.4 TaxID=396776 RepID=A0A0J8RWB4_COCIT|nr:hypothetical protein CIHG_07025 [Coccidioides immitis H538.4]
MNRRHSAYCLVGYAVRFGIIMGLHLNVPQNQLPSRELQEHRNRVWWTAYILDRSWACMLGKPVSIQDEDIDRVFVLPIWVLRSPDQSIVGEHTVAPFLAGSNKRTAK